MKIKITLKDTDTLYDAINENVEDLKIEGVSDEELEGVRELRKEEYKQIASKWFEYDEYLTVEMDTSDKTLRVVPLSEIR